MHEFLSDRERELKLAVAVVISVLRTLWISARQAGWGPTQSKRGLPVPPPSETCPPFPLAAPTTPPPPAHEALCVPRTLPRSLMPLSDQGSASAQGKAGRLIVSVVATRSGSAPGIEVWVRGAGLPSPGGMVADARCDQKL